MAMPRLNAAAIIHTPAGEFTCTFHREFGVSQKLISFWPGSLGVPGGSG